MWHTPQSVEEAVGLLSACPAETPFLATGAAEPPSPSLPLPPEATVVSTAALRSIVEHRRDDLTVTVRAGARAGGLNAELSPAAQWIPVEPQAADLSVGGLIGSALPGAFDAAFGPVRRQLLALRLVSGGGREYRWGRPVVKNVAGYDVPRLACGSFGRLGLITEATFRLWPLPAVSVRHRVEGRGARRVARALCEGADTTTATPGMRWSWKAARDDRADPGQAADHREHLTLWLLGSERSVLTRTSALADVAAAHGVELGTSTSMSAAVPRAGEPLRAAEPLRDAGEPRKELRSPEDCVLRISSLAAFLWELPDRLAEVVGDRLRRIDAYPGSGVLRVEYSRAGADSRELIDQLLGACEESPVSVERGGPTEHERVRASRPAVVRELEERVVAALGGRPRRWQADYL